MFILCLRTQEIFSKIQKMHDGSDTVMRNAIVTYVSMISYDIQVKSMAYGSMLLCLTKAFAVAGGYMENAMKRILSVVVLLMTSITLLAQNDVTRFMGIPVDGFKSDMIRKLKEKGFVTSMHDKNVLEGEFNGIRVNVHVATNNNKVCRIMLRDVNPVNETDIKIRFNTLCRQFKNNSEYISYDDYTIPDDEDISYEMSVNKKTMRLYSISGF